MSSSSTPLSGLQLRSLVKDTGDLELSLVEVPVPEPGADQVVVRVEAAPINPSDLGLLLAGAEVSGARTTGTTERPVTVAALSAPALRALAARVGQSLPVGNEGAGVVVAAGASPQAQALLGRPVALFGGGLYAHYRMAAAADCLPLPDGATPADGASCFVNPLTALGMVETMRRENHTALVHTAAASNLGQMLNRICLADGVALVNIVRDQGQAERLRAQGAVHVCDSTRASFMDDLVAALTATGATLAFDAVGGGRLAGQILTAMEIAAGRAASGYSRYGSSTHKQVYIYGGLDTGPTELTRGFGMAWGLGGWLLPLFLAKIGAEAGARLRQRVAAELKTTFASHYTQEISLFEALQPAVMARYNRKATGEKYLINPSRPS